MSQTHQAKCRYRDVFTILNPVQRGFLVQRLTCPPPILPLLLDFRVVDRCAFEPGQLLADAAEKNLAGRSFPWLVVRPGSLVDRDGTGKVAFGTRAPIDIPVSVSSMATVEVCHSLCDQCPSEA